MENIIERGSCVSLTNINLGDVFIVTNVIDNDTVEVECVEVKHVMNGKYIFKKSDLKNV